MSATHTFAALYIGNKKVGLKPYLETLWRNFPTTKTNTRKSLDKNRIRTHFITPYSIGSEFKPYK